MTTAEQLSVDGLISFYPCQDIAATVDFYTRDLGLSLVRDQDRCVIFRAAQQAYLGFCVHEGDLPTHRGVIITFVTDKVDEIYRRFRLLNIETEAEPQDNSLYGIYHFFARDPDGYRIEIQRFYEPL